MQINADDTYPEFLDDDIDVEPSFSESAFGQLDPAQIKTLTPSYGEQPLEPDEIGFAFEHSQLIKWARVLERSYGGALHSATPFIGELHLTATCARLTASDHGSLLGIRLNYFEPPLNMKPDDDIKLYVRCSDLPEILLEQSPLKCFRYSRSKSTLRMHSDGFQRPLVLHQSKLFLRGDAGISGELPVNGKPFDPTLMHHLVARASRFVSDHDPDLDFVQISDRTIRAGDKQTCLILLRFKSIDPDLGFSIIRQRLPAFQAAIKMMRSPSFSSSNGFNFVFDETLVFGWQKSSRGSIPTALNSKGTLGTLVMPRSTVSAILERLHALLPDCPAEFTIRNSAPPHNLEISAHADGGRKALRSRSDVSFQPQPGTRFPVKFRLKPRYILQALMTEETTNIEIQIEIGAARLMLGNGLDTAGSEAIFDTSSKVR